MAAVSDFRPRRMQSARLMSFPGAGVVFFGSLSAAAKRRIYASLSLSSPESTRKDATASITAVWFGLRMGRSSPA